MKIAVVGAGVVGLTTGAGLAELGHGVVCVDIDKVKIMRLQTGDIPFHEPGLQELTGRNMRAGRLRFGLGMADVPADTEMVFVAVGTPADERGDLSLAAFGSAVDGVAAWLAGVGGSDDGGLVRGGSVIVAVKSTVPVGTADRAEQKLRETLNGGRRVEVASVPEFMREGSAVRDFFEPARLVIGAASREVAERLQSLHAGLPGEVVVTDRRSAELAKLAANSFLAVKISYANEIAALAERMGADYADVARVLGTDPRIGPHFLGAGLGFGGSCLPKDTRALVRMADEWAAPLTLVEAAIRTNLSQIERLVDQMEAALDELYRGRQGHTLKIALLGLAFKAGTDDMREAPSLRLAEALLARFPGVSLSACDPAAQQPARHLLPQEVEICASAEEALRGADAAVVVTEWPEFREIRADDFKKWMNHPIIWDGRNVLDAELLRSQGVTYAGTGRMADGNAASKRQPEHPVPQT